MFSTIRALLLLCICLPGLALASERWFSIQVIVFERVNNNAHLEHWPAPQDLAFPRPRLFFPSDSNALDADTTIREMDFNGPLSGALQTLQRSGAYRVLAARQWQQSLLPKHRAPHLVFKGGRMVGERHELEGSLQFSVERYLHLNANLWYTEFGSDREVADNYVTPGLESEDDYAAATPGWILPAVPQPPISVLTDSDATGALGAAATTLDNNAQSIDSASATAVWPIERITTLQQQRRLRSTETHYIDHPLFAMLVHILPLKSAGGDEEDIL